MTYLTRFTQNLWSLLLDAAPWLLVGLLAAALIHALIPTRSIARYLGRPGLASVTRAALIGTPLPLCSCAVLPAAVGLRRAGAGRGATVSFLVATPENGADSIALSYALLGPFMAVARPIAAILSAITAGLLADASPQPRDARPTEQQTTPEAPTTCCADDHRSQTHRPITARLSRGLRFAATDVLDDLTPWLALGLILAAAISTAVPPGALPQWTAGLPAMLLMLLIGLPMYICATASTPVAASMLIAGLSPGAVLVFLLAGPATNIAGIAVVKRQLGLSTAVAYLLGICAGALTAGLLTNAAADWLNISITAQAAAAETFIPRWLAVASAALLILLAVRPLRRRLLKLAPAAARTSGAHQ